jgi:colanic acid/amylovoran biosynthesis glycosyltransferase
MIFHKPDLSPQETGSTPSSSVSPPRVVHLFSRYLDSSMNWVYFLLKNTPAQHTISAEVYTSGREFFPAGFRFIKALGFLPAYINYHMLRFILRRKLASRQIVHAHFANLAWKYFSLVKSSGLPYVVSFYGHDYESLPYTDPVWLERYKQMFKTADLFICEGVNGKKILESYGCDPSRIRVIPLGIETANVEVVRREKPAGVLKMVQLASFREKKGHVYTIKAFAKALKTCPGMELTLIGEDTGGLKSGLYELASGLGIANKVMFIDGIPYAQVYNVLKHYHVFIQPSCYAANRDCEGGAPVSLLNAQASGMPVISTNHCDIPSVVIHAKTGLLTAEKDVDALAASIENFYKMDDSTYQEFCKNARRHVEQNFEASACGLLLAKAYAELSCKNISA